MNGTFPENRFPPTQINIANPGAGVRCDITPTLGHAWRVLSIVFTFTADATVIGRHCGWLLRGGLADTGWVFHDSPVTATNNGIFHVNPGFRGNPFTIGNYYELPLMNDCIITDDVWIRLDAINFQGGDTFTSIVISYERFLKE